MLKKRIRKFLPVVIDLETGGLDYQKNPLLEAAIQLLDFDDNHFILGELTRFHTVSYTHLTLPTSNDV